MKKLNWKLSTWLIVGLIAFLFTLRAAQHQYERGNADNTFLLELVDSLGDFKGPYTKSVASTMIALPTWTEIPEKVCGLSFDIPAESVNYFQRVHPYFILYLVAPFKKIFSSLDILSFLMALSFSGLAFFLLYKFNRSGIPFAVALLFIHMATSHPGWIGGLQGQAYIDRLFVFFGGILFWYILQSQEQKLSRWVYVFVVLAALINDRTGIQAGIFVGGFGVLYWFKNRNSKTLVALGFLLCLVSAFLIFSYVKGYNQTADSASQMGRLGHALRSLDAKTTTMYFFALLLLGPWSWREPRLLVIAFAAMLPNLLVSTGGSEKIGFTAHYQSGYLPVLIAISAYTFKVGYTQGTRALRGFYVGYLAISSLLLLGISNDFSRGVDYRFDWTKSSFVSVYEMAHSTPDYERLVKEEIRKIIPAGATVSTSEFNYKLFWNYAQVYYFPSGMDQTDYIVLYKHSEFSSPTVAGSMLGKTDQERLHNCFWERIQMTYKKRYDVPNLPFIVMGR